MSLADALTITALGMGMVFLGLILTSALIISFSWIGRLRESPAATAPSELAQADTPQAPGERLAPEVIAVIAAVLETERRLYHPEPGRLTIAREPARVRRNDAREDEP